MLDIKIKEILPYRMIREIEKRMSNDLILEEIRIRVNRQAYIVLGGMNIIINYVATDDEMLKILKIISHYSLYAYKDTLSQGYISLDNGIRVGVIGRASVEGDNIIGAVNFVLVDSTDKGYGIFITNMLEEAEN